MNSINITFTVIPETCCVTKLDFYVFYLHYDTNNK